MNQLPRFNNLSRFSQLSIVAVGVLFVGLFLAVNFSLQNQDTRSKAAGEGAAVQFYQAVPKPYSKVVNGTTYSSNVNPHGIETYVCNSKSGTVKNGSGFVVDAIANHIQNSCIPSASVTNTKKLWSTTIRPLSIYNDFSTCRNYQIGTDAAYQTQDTRTLNGTTASNATAAICTTGALGQPGTTPFLSISKSYVYDASLCQNGNAVVLAGNAAPISSTCQALNLADVKNNPQNYSASQLACLLYVDDFVNLQACKNGVCSTQKVETRVKQTNGTYKNDPVLYKNVCSLFTQGNGTYTVSMKAYDDHDEVYGSSNLWLTSLIPYIAPTATKTPVYPTATKAPTATPTKAPVYPTATPVYPTPTATACYPAPTNIIGWWKAQGNGIDSAKGNTATLLGGTTFGTGKVGSAFAFTGTTNDKVVTIPYNSLLNASSQVTLEAWINPSTINPATVHPINSYGTIIAKSNIPTTRNYGLYLYTGGQLHLSFVDTAGVNTWVNTPSNAIAPNTWQHVAATITWGNGGTMNIYVNGVLKATKSIANLPKTDASPLTIGNELNRIPFAGLIDEATVYGRALTLAEIQKVYTAQANGKCAVVTPTPTTYYPPTATVYPPTATVYPPTATVYPPTATVYPSPTYSPLATTFTLNLLLHGLGNGGDNANPNGTGNFNPLHPQRTVTVEAYNSQNQLVTTKQGSVTFNSTTGRFGGTIDMGTVLTSGVYTVRVKTSQLLRALVPGIQTVTSGQAVTLPSTALITGDVNNDNFLNILDYNILMGCYSDLAPATNCTAANKLLTDITDDGNVNQFDYNLFLRELSTLTGQ